MITVCGSWYYSTKDNVTIQKCSLGEFCPFVEAPDIICGMNLSQKQTIIEEKPTCQMIKSISLVTLHSG